MKINRILQFCCLASLLGPAVAGLSAASVGFSFAATNMGGTASSSVLYFGTITNNDVSGVFLTSESVSVGGFTVDYSPFSGQLGLLGAGSSTGITGLFAVAIPSAGSNPYGLYTGSYDLLGGANPGDTNTLASGSFLLDVVPVLPPDLVSLQPATQYGAPGSTLTFGGTIANGGASVLFLNGANVNAPFPLSGDAGPFLASPLSLNPGTFEYGLPLFTIAIPADTTPGTLPGGSLTITGGADGSAQDNLGSADFTVVVTPEPATWMLLAAGGLLAAVRRWRR